MRWQPRDVVALILALCVFMFVASGTSLRLVLFAWTGVVPAPVSQGTIEAWESVINVIVGVLAAYIGSRIADKWDKPPDGK